MYACLFCIVCIYYTSTQDQIHVTSIAHGNPKHICPGVQNKTKKLKTRLSKTLANHLKTTPGIERKQPVQTLPPTTGLLTSGSSCIHVCEDVRACVCVFECVCVYTRA